MSDLIETIVFWIVRAFAGLMFGFAALICEEMIRVWVIAYFQGREIPPAIYWIVPLCVPLIYLFCILSWRTITGKSRSDGGLLPPATLMVFAVIFGIIPVAAAILAIYQEDYWRALIFPLYFLPAAALFGIARQRMSASNHSLKLDGPDGPPT